MHCRHTQLSVVTSVVARSTVALCLTAVVRMELTDRLLLLRLRYWVALFAQRPHAVLDSRPATPRGAMSDHPLIKAEQIGRISAVAGWLGVLMIAILSLVPGNLRPHTVLPGPLEHTLAYALTGAALACGYRRMDFRLLCLVGLSAGSVVLEILQVFIPGVPHLPLTRWQVRAAPRWACCLERFFRNCSSLRRGNDIKKRSLADLIQCAPTTRIADGALGRREPTEDIDAARKHQALLVAATPSCSLTRCEFP